MLTVETKSSILLGMLLTSVGNDNLNQLTSTKRYKLRIDMSTVDGNTSYAEYDNFQLNSAADNYRLASVGNFNGPAGGFKTDRNKNSLHSYQQLLVLAE